MTDRRRELVGVRVPTKDSHHTSQWQVPARLSSNRKLKTATS